MGSKMLIKRKILIIILIVACVAAAIWVMKYPMLYHYYLWKLNHTADGKEMLVLTDNIETISPHIVPLLVRTYEDTSASVKVRNAAALSLVKVDRERAEALSIKFLQDKDNEVLAMAIFILGEAKSTKPYRAILQSADSKDEKVRWAVVSYLGNFKNDESISMLKHIQENDPSENIRGWAAYYLRLFGVSFSK